MKTLRNMIGGWLLVLMGACLAGAQTVPELINYQGKLMDGTNLFSGSLPMTFRLYNTPEGGDFPLCESTNRVLVVDGLYSAYIGDNITFGGLDNALYQDEVWIEVEIDGHVMTPRERLVSVGYARLAAALPANAVNAGMIRENAVSFWHIGNGQVRNTHLQAGSVTSNKIDWSTMPEPQRLLAYAENGDFADAPQATGDNAIALGAGARAEGSSSTVGGGLDNQAAFMYDAVGGGRNNLAAGLAATVGGGRYNRASGLTSTVAGGYSNRAVGAWTTIGGGQLNQATMGSATVAGGSENRATAINATVGGGEDNWARGPSATIGGGTLNIAYDGYNTVAGGYSNRTGGANSTVGGGRDNMVEGFAGTIAGGIRNRTGIGVHGATVSGGDDNAADHDYTTIGGGKMNKALYPFATVGGGQDNQAAHHYATVGGGQDNIAAGDRSTIGGGYLNIASNSAATVGGGLENTASALAATVGGGSNNRAEGRYATIPGGLGARAETWGQQAYASGTFSVPGDAQAGLYVLRRQTSGSAWHNLFLDGSSRHIQVAPLQVVTFEALVAAQSDLGQIAGYRVVGVLRGLAGGGVEPFGVTVTTLHETVPAWDVRIHYPGDATQNFYFQVRGSDRSTRWVATVRTAELKYW